MDGFPDPFKCFDDADRSRSRVLWMWALGELHR